MFRNEGPGLRIIFASRVTVPASTAVGIIRNEVPFQVIEIHRGGRIDQAAVRIAVVRGHGRRQGRDQDQDRRQDKENAGPLRY